MPEVRTDPISGQQVIIAPDRLTRPNAISLAPWDYNDADDCPFCVGRETETPAELVRYRANDQTDPWSVRVVPNRYPALTDGADRNGRTGTGLVAHWPARGRHEVIIESPWHLASFTELDTQSTAVAVQAYRDRLASCAADDQFACGLVFKNYGPRAGASLGHVHSQFAAFATVPPLLQTEYRVAEKYYRQRGTCLFCAILAAEFQSESRLVGTHDQFAAFCPAASRLPYELWIAPQRHQPRFEQLSDADCHALGTFLHRLLARLERLIPHVAYNFFIHSAAFDGGFYDHYHWHLELIPRLAITAGFEWGSGQWINPVPPEQAAEQLRSFEDDRIC